MKCCSDCFSSPHLKAIIDSGNSIGSCDFCKSENLMTVDPSELSIIFQNILSLYSLSENGHPLNHQIHSDFNNQIFSEKIGINSLNLIKSIIREEIEAYQSIVDSNVSSAHEFDEGTQAQVDHLRISWDELVNEIKYVNRFHLQKTINLQKLETLLKRYQKPIFAGSLFHRSRLCDEDGLTLSEMRNPPVNKTKSGRANPQGISYLYLSSEEMTTLYETRASLYDFVTIGEFRLKRNISIINLRGNLFDPASLADEENLEDVLIHQSFIKNLEDALSKPKRRTDHELDYLPTQYLCEFIKSMGFDGVEFKSSLTEDGYNLAIFRPENFVCTRTKVCEITEVGLTHQLL